MFDKIFSFLENKRKKPDTRLHLVPNANEESQVFTYQNKKITFLREKAVRLQNGQEGYAVYFMESPGIALKLEVEASKIPSGFFSENERVKRQAIQLLLDRFPAYSVTI